MTPQPPRDYGDLTPLMHAAIQSMIAEMQIVKSKVDTLSQDRVTRSDLKELSNSFVSRDYYNVAQRQVEDAILDVRKDIETVRNEMQQSQQRLHDRLESGKQQIEDRFKQQQEAQLSGKDRAWVRSSQIFGFLAVIIAIVDLLVQLAQHLRFS